MLGEFDAALPYAQRAVAIWDAQPQPNRSLQAMAINNLGYLHRVRAEYDLALEYLRRALAIRQEIYATSSYIGMTRNHIGRVYYYQGRYAQALIELEAALAMIEAAVGREHPYTANVLSNLGIVALDMGDTAQAQRQLAEALDIHRRMVGPEHWYVARDLNRLGLLRLSLGDNAAAYRCFRTAWRIRRRIFGELHPDTANTLSHIGMLYLTNGRMPQARLLATEALRCHQLRLGERHPYTARSLLRVGQVYAALGDQAAARDYVARAIAIYLAVLGPDHPYTRPPGRRQGEDCNCAPSPLHRAHTEKSRFADQFGVVFWVFCGKVRGGQRFEYLLKSETGPNQWVYHGAERATVRGHLHRDAKTMPFVCYLLDGKVGAGGAVLEEFGLWMFYREDDMAALPQDAVKFGEGLLPVSHIVEHKRADHQIK